MKKLKNYTNHKPMRYIMKSHYMLFTLALISVLSISHASENWTGDGGKGMGITVFAPQASGLAENQSHLPTLVQSEFVSNFSNYSAITVTDWERLDDIYEKLFSEHYDENAEARQDLGSLTPTTHFMSGKITKTPTGFHLQVSVIKTSDKTIAASYSGNFSYWDLNNLTGIRRASLDMLQKMGVTLTAKAQQELSGATSDNHARAQAAFAKGITAQRQGTEVAALSYYFEAATFDPSMSQAVNRSSILNANIASGNIGDNVRNDIAWRRQWVERLKETEQFFDNFNKMEAIPYTLFYSNDIKQGAVNYQNETVNISIETYLYGSGVWTLSIERTLQAVYDGLNATGRKDVWELGRWPQHGVTNLNVFTERRKNFSVVFELVNNQNKVIGRQTLQSGGSWGLNWSGRPRVEMSQPDRKTLNFQNVSANDITDNLTIRVATVNGTDAETAAINGVLQIKSVTKGEVFANDRFRFAKGEIQGFANYEDRNREVALAIPSTIWGDPVISIGERAFFDNRLTRIIIGANIAMSSNSFGGYGFHAFPDSYNKNGRKLGIYDQSIFRFENGQIKGFVNNSSLKMTSLVIPETIWGNPVTSIADGAFKENAFTGISIPNSVVFVGSEAFFQNSFLLKNVTVGANVIMKRNSFGFKHNETYTKNQVQYTRTVIKNGFQESYEKNGNKAGFYVFRANIFMVDSSIGDWVYSKSRERLAEEIKAKKEEQEKIDMRPVKLGWRISGGFAATFDGSNSKWFDAHTSYSNMGESQMNSSLQGGFVMPGLTLNIWPSDFLALITELNYYFFTSRYCYGGKECFSTKDENYIIGVTMYNHTISIPVLLRLGPRDAAYIEGGYQLGFPLSSSLEIKKGDMFSYKEYIGEINISEFRQRMDHAIIFGVGTQDIGGFNFGLRFIYHLTKLDKNDSFKAPFAFGIMFGNNFF